MILLLWGMLLALALILTISAYFLDAPHIAITGYTFLFILGVLLLGNNVEINTGETINKTFTYVGNLTNSSSSVSTLQYTPYVGQYARIMGILLAVIGVAGASITLYTFRLNKEET